MTSIETIEGIINGTIWYHYDVSGDVLYLSLLSDMQTPAIGEETDDGFIERREESTGRLIGVTIVSWWKRFGQGPLPDSIAQIQAHIEPLAQRVAA